MIENFFTEERRIKDIVNDAVREARFEEREKFEAERKQMQIKEIRRLSNLGLSNERIHKETGYSLNFINNTLET